MNTPLPAKQIAPAPVDAVAIDPSVSVRFGIPEDQALAMIERAAEIQRYEPGVVSVDLVELSLDRSTPESPVYFVTYTGRDGRPANRYFTKWQLIGDQPQ